MSIRARFRQLRSHLTWRNLRSVATRIPRRARIAVETIWGIILALSGLFLTAVGVHDLLLATRSQEQFVGTVLAVAGVASLTALLLIRRRNRKWLIRMLLLVSISGGAATLRDSGQLPTRRVCLGLVDRFGGASNWHTLVGTQLSTAWWR
jgi:uncharacterized membrane protein HdeD (DUF308 family)